MENVLINGADAIAADSQNALRVVQTTDPMELGPISSVLPGVYDRLGMEETRHALISVRTPRNLRCGDPGCACACHLGQYLRTPRFLQRFIGALQFRGTCKNHGAKLWEAKYWVPEWVSNYNIYLLFERTASGDPSLGLKFQRKVPWGTEDTIIRFSFSGDVNGIKAILMSKTGSLNDIDPNHGRTALHVSPALIALK